MSAPSHKCYVDSNILIYVVDGGPTYQAQASDMLERLAPDSSFVTSELTLGECLRGALRRGNIGSAESYRLLLQNTDFISLSPVTLAIIKRAAELGAELNMKLLDALHVATAEALACTVFLTNDRGIRAPAGMTLKHLDGPDHSPPPSP